MSDEKPDWSVFVENVDLPPISLEERAALIAAVLRKGNPSEMFCGLLASMIGEDRRNMTKFKLTLSMKNRGNPSRPNVALGRAMVVSTAGVPRGHLKAIKTDIAKQFGVTVRTAEKAMADELRFQEVSQMLDNAPAQIVESAKRKEMPE